MSDQHTIIVHSIEEDGLPDVVDVDTDETGMLAPRFDQRVGFLFYNLIFMGHPLPPDENGQVDWVAEDPDGAPMTVTMAGQQVNRFTDITHWVEFPMQVQQLLEPSERPGLRIVE